MNCKNFFRKHFFVFSLILLIGIFPFVIAEYDSLNAYCVGEGFEEINQDCVQDVLESGDADLIGLVDFNALDATIWNEDISKLVAENPSLLDKYAQEILSGKVALIKGADSYENILFTKNGILDFDQGPVYDLTKIPEGSKVTLNDNGIVIDLDDGKELGDLSGISLEGEFLLEKGFNLNGELIQIPDGNLIVDADGNIFIPEGTLVKLPNGVSLGNFNEEMVHLSIGSESEFANSVSLYEEGGIKNLLAKCSPDGRYSLEFTDGKNIMLSGGETGSTTLFRDADFGTKTLRVGSSGESVEEVQRVVGAQVDGDFGSNTKTAVEKWQKNWNLNNPDDQIDVDGVVDLDTRTRLEQTFGDYSIIETSGDEIKWIQNSKGEYFTAIYDDGSIISVGKSPNSFVVDYTISEPQGDLIKPSSVVKYSDVEVSENSDIDSTSTKLDTKGSSVQKFNVDKQSASQIIKDDISASAKSLNTKNGVGNCFKSAEKVMENAGSGYGKKIVYSKGPNAYDTLSPIPKARNYLGNKNLVEFIKEKGTLLAQWNIEGASWQHSEIILGCANADCSILLTFGSPGGNKPYRYTQRSISDLVALWEFVPV